MSANSTVTLGRLYLAISLVLIALILWQGIGMMRTRRQTAEIRGQISSLQKKDSAAPTPAPEVQPTPTPTPQPTPTPPEDPLAYITKKGLFSPAPPPPMLPECTGILGDRVILNNQFKKVGEEMDGWKVEKIGTERVTLRRNEDVAEVQLAKPTTWPMPPPPPMPACTGIFGDTALLNNELHRIGDKIGDWEVTLITLDKVFIRNKEGNTNELPLVQEAKWPETPPPQEEPPKQEAPKQETPQADASPKSPDQPPAGGPPPQPGTNPSAPTDGAVVQNAPDQPGQPQPGNPEQSQQGGNRRGRRPRR
jgi:hypothetical protein